MGRQKGSKNGITKTSKPVSEQDINDHLEGLNRVTESAVVSIDTDRMKAIAIANYLEWFKERGITVVQKKGRYVVPCDDISYPACFLWLAIHSISQETQGEN